MFESVNCHTLFLPATKKLLLQDLSVVNCELLKYKHNNFIICQATEEELTDEYRVERDKLLAELRNDIKPKEKNGTCLQYCWHFCEK